MDKVDQPILIIGAGPAGIAAGIQLKRYGMPALLLDRREPGGLLWNANLVENYPGFPNGVSGAKLVGLMKEQMGRLGVNVEREDVQLADWVDDHFLVTTQQAERSTHTLVIASGTRSLPLPDVIHPDALGRVFTEVRDLTGVEGRQIVIIGAGDAAFDYALNLSKKRNFVTILNRGEAIKCLPLLYERAAQEPSIQYRAGVSLSQVKLDEKSGGLLLRVASAQSGITLLDADYLLFAIGRVPCTGFLSAGIMQREHELVEAGRLYWIGDVKNGSFRQAVIAAGDGLRAAMQIHLRNTS